MLGANVPIGDVHADDHHAFGLDALGTHGAGAQILLKPLLGLTRQGQGLVGRVAILGEHHPVMAQLCAARRYAMRLPGCADSTSFISRSAARDVCSAIVPSDPGSY
jgi:hypothetical protein